VEANNTAHKKEKREFCKVKRRCREAADHTAFPRLRRGKANNTALKKRKSGVLSSKTPLP
ncbi:MAG: hypothetical protein K2N38_08815, partial [Oscillospiraceae bacterium]|nr:hypothetical protein [Oscillospiraceae bacterium]